MKIGVVGLRHVGLVTAACLAHVGHEVAGVDDERIEGLRRGQIPFFEPGLEDLVYGGLAWGRLRFADRAGAA